jgi:hypothetical protein
VGVDDHDPFLVGGADLASDGAERCRYESVGPLEVSREAMALTVAVAYSFLGCSVLGLR